jgi:competence protein ComGC
MKPHSHSHSACRGLSLLEVMIVVATIALLIVAVLPRLARTNARSSRISCTSNLKQIGLACRLWSNDNNDEFPWVSTNSAGSRAYVNSPQVFQHFAIMSNELVTPKILTCPDDKQRKKTPDFAKLSSLNLSYLVALDADESKPSRLLSGDRNLTGGTLSNGFLRFLPTNALAGWTSELHNNAGNIGLSDGSVQLVTPVDLRKYLQAQDRPIIRLAIP